MDGIKDHVCYKDTGLHRQKQDACKYKIQKQALQPCVEEGAVQDHKRNKLKKQSSPWMSCGLKMQVQKKSGYDTKGKGQNIPGTFAENLPAIVFHKKACARIARNLLCNC